MNEEIGNIAGKIWAFLNENGPSSVNKITTDTGLSRNEVHRAIGWLAREEKISFEEKGRTETISLI